MPALQSTRWCFTINAPASGAAVPFPDPLPADEDIWVYLVQGKETGETGRRHIQGFGVLKIKKTLTAVKRIHATAHWEVARGTSLQAAEYCKEDGDFIEFGVPPVERQRTDLMATVNALDTHSLDDLALDPEHAEVIARHMNYFRNVSSIKRRRVNTAELRERMASASLRRWQSDLLEIVLEVPDSRKVIWSYDEVGNSGKSFFTDYLVAMHEAIVFTGGKLADIAHAYDMQKIVIFDIARTKADCMNGIYEAVETFKNGRIFSPKYESQVKVFPVPHVLCFANFAPDTEKLSADRWDIRVIDGNRHTFV